MPSDLSLAQKYPFLPLTKKIVKNSGLNLDSVPEPVLERAKAMVKIAQEEKDYNPHISISEELLKNEVLAFPVAKILISVINSEDLFRKFSKMFENSIFSNLENEKDEFLIDIGMDLGLKFNLAEKYFVELSVPDFLRASFSTPFMKIVNMPVEKGFVFLERNDYCRFLSSLAATGIRNSLPVPLDGIPKVFSETASSLQKNYSEKVKKDFSSQDFGSVTPENFPPCMSKIYSELLSGLNVNHSARFAIATFLASIGMNKEQIVDLFRKTPNFNERTTAYQVSRITGGKGYSSPSCDKMRTYGLCVAECKVVHPVQFYQNEKDK